MALDLPQLSGAGAFLTDGGLETSLVFHDGMDLPDFAAFPLLDTEVGRDALRRYYVPYLALAARSGAGFVMDTPTWRANPDWAARAGLDMHALADVNRRSVVFAFALGAEYPDVTTVVNGVIGPRGDGYVVGDTMTVEEAMVYHQGQVDAFAEAGAAMISAVTITYVQEAIGIARAAAASGLAAVVSFTVETDGHLPSGATIAEAVTRVDEVAGDAVAYYMVNCAHPTHFLDQLDPGAAWSSRVRGVRANASRSSHAELDAAEELDRGDIGELAGLYTALDRVLDLRVVGGCCGTDIEHVTAIAGAVSST